MASVCCFIPLVFILFALLTRLTLSGDMWLAISLVFIVMGVFGLVFALHDYRRRADKYRLFLVAGNAVVVILSMLNCVAYM